MAPPSPHSGLLSGGGSADTPLPRPQLAPAALLCNPQVARKLRRSGLMSPAWRAWSLPSLHRSLPSQRLWPPSSRLAPPWHPGFPSGAQPHLSRLPGGPSLPPVAPAPAGASPLPDPLPRYQQLGLDLPPSQHPWWPPLGQWRLL